MRRSVTVYKISKNKVRAQETRNVSNAGADPVSKFRGAISVIFRSQVSLRVHCNQRDEVWFTALELQKWTAKWPYIANAGFQIVQNHDEKCYFFKF